MADKCVKCSEEFDNVLEAAKCADCSGSFHPACCGKSLDAVRKLRSGTRKWRCEECKSESSSTQSRSDADTSEPATVMEMFKALRSDMAKNMNESRQRFDGVDTVLKDVKTTLNEYKGKIQALEQENINLNKRCDEQKQSLDVATKTITTLQRDVLELQQYSRRNNVEIKGIPWKENEDIYFILDSIAKALNVPFYRGDISIAHRLPARNQGDAPVIIAAFVMRSTREMWLQAARTRRLTTADISTHLGQPGNVFVNPHLAGHNKAILGRAKRMVKEGKLHAAWANDGRIMVKHRQGDAAQRAYQLDDLDKFDK